MESGDLPENVATPRDVRLLHLILASMGVTSYQERVPLQLMDFAYRYTQGVLHDALLYSDHAAAANNSHNDKTGPVSGGSGGNANAAAAAVSTSALSVEDVRLAIAARVNYQFKPAPPKELLLEMAQERNRRALPQVQPGYGLRLPPEKYCLTAKEWDLDEEEEETAEGAEGETNNNSNINSNNSNNSSEDKEMKDAV